ncbi:MAG: hypothetical protein PHS59_09960 [Paludibacter sp.]|nr:hypothetical protein [Paludibacter sp.]
MKTNIKVSAKVIIIMIFTIFSSSILYAQPGQGQGGQQGPPPIPNAKQVTALVNDLSKELTLSDTQKASVSKLYTAHFDELRKMTSDNAKPKREEMDALKTDLEKQVKAVLTKDQQKKYAAYLKKQDPRQGGGQTRQ